MGICWFETADRHSSLVSDLKLINRGVGWSRRGKRYTDCRYLRGTLSGPDTETASYL
jgi:hypothetical protein